MYWNGTQDYVNIDAHSLKRIEFSLKVNLNVPCCTICELSAEGYYTGILCDLSLQTTDRNLLPTLALSNPLLFGTDYFQTTTNKLPYLYEGKVNIRVHVFGNNSSARLRSGSVMSKT